MAFSTGSNRSSCEINVTPLIDVLLVLLIIFMVIVPKGVHGLEAATPQRSTAPDQVQEQSPVVIQAVAAAQGLPDSEAEYCIDRRPVREEALDAQLRSLLANRAERQVIVQADAEFNFGVVSALVDRAHAAGADTVGMAGPENKTGCNQGS